MNTSHNHPSLRMIKPDAIQQESWVDRADFLLEYYPEDLQMEHIFWGWRKILKPFYWHRKAVVSLLKLAVWLSREKNLGWARK